VGKAEGKGPKEQGTSRFFTLNTNIERLHYSPSYRTPFPPSNATHESVASQQRERREMAKTSKEQRKWQAAATKIIKKLE